MIKRFLVNAEFWVEGRQEPFNGCVLYEFKESGPECYQKLDQKCRHPRFLFEDMIKGKDKSTDFIKFYNEFPSNSWVDCLLNKMLLHTWHLEKGIMYIPVKKICAFNIYSSISAFIVQDGDSQTEIDKVLESQGGFGLEEINSISREESSKAIFEVVTN